VTVLDASAMLAFLQGERGDDVVEAALLEGATCGSANWSEVAQKVLAAGRDWGTASALLGSYDLVVEPVTKEDAETAAAAWNPRSKLSLADRLCVALARRLEVTALTADRTWGTSAPVRQIR
jgi:ribonuclease VapC